MRGIGNDVPDGLEIYVEIVVNEHVPHPGNRLPIDLGVLVFINRADPANQFAEHLKL